MTYDGAVAPATAPLFHFIPCIREISDGSSTTTKMAGKMQNTRGKIIFTGAFMAWVLARCLRRSRMLSAWITRVSDMEAPSRSDWTQEPEVKLGRLQIFNNWSPYLVRDPLHTLWIGLEYFCQEGDALWSMTDEDFLAFAAKELETIQVIRPGAVQEGHVVRMKKAYPAYYGSYRDFPRLRQELDTIPNLYCMGRNGQHRYNNMDHSMLSALTAVDLIRQGETNKTALWQVNTEQEYQETETQGGQNHEK